MSLRNLVATALVMLFAVSVTVSAQTVGELRDADKLRIRTWVQPDKNIVPGQQLNLFIEIATDKWFSGGTRIGRFEVEDAIVLQREKFAVNSTQKELGQSWTVQMWTLTVYPQRSGPFEIPAIPIRVSIAGKNLESIVGEIQTNPLSFTTHKPQELDIADNWVATSRFEVRESFNKSIEELKTGDALVRTINMSADDLPAMMLPGFAAEEIPGLAIYKKPPSVNDKVNRGDYTAERTEILTYVFEQVGDYELPPRTFYWWNTASETLESVILSGHSLSVTNLPGQVTIPDEEEAAAAPSIDIRAIVINAIMALAVLAIVAFIVRRVSTLIRQVKLRKPTQATEKQLRREFASACRNNDREKAVGLFYQWLDYYGDEHFQGSIRAFLTQLNHDKLASVFSNLMQSIYASNQKDNKTELVYFANQLFKELKQLKRPNIFSRRPVELRLN
jgi:hypothetical protein